MFVRNGGMAQRLSTKGHRTTAKSTSFT